MICVVYGDTRVRIAMKRDIVIALTTLSHHNESRLQTWYKQNYDYLYDNVPVHWLDQLNNK